MARLQTTPWYRGQLVSLETQPGREAEFGELDPPLPARIRTALREMGIHRLYRHQTQAVDALRGGSHVAVSTSTASGKSLCYLLPILESLLNDPSATALLIFPTKALAHDQIHAVRKLLRLVGLERPSAGGAPRASDGADDATGDGEADGEGCAEGDGDCAVGTTGGGRETKGGPDPPPTPLASSAVMALDGDASSEARCAARDHARILVTNPDAMHAAMLPNHGRWARVLGGLAFVVVDEAHVYRGAFGSAVSMVLRRLARVCALAAGRRPAFCACTATLGNPREHVAALLGVEPSRLVLVDSDASPSAPRLCATWVAAERREEQASASDALPPLLRVLERVREERTRASASPGGKAAADEPVDVDGARGSWRRAGRPTGDGARGRGDGDGGGAVAPPGPASEPGVGDSLGEASSGDAAADDREPVVRNSPILEASKILADAVAYGLQAVAFCKSRKLCELVLSHAREELQALVAEGQRARKGGEGGPAEPPPPRRAEREPQGGLDPTRCLAAYRAGYSPAERRRLEAGLRDGTLRGVTATNALELGVDVGGLDVVVHLGWPGSRASLQQQAGRAGRRAGGREPRSPGLGGPGRRDGGGDGRPSLPHPPLPCASIFVPFDSPLDRWLLRNPSEIRRGRVEDAVLSPGARGEGDYHLVCAATELALRGWELDDEPDGGGAGVGASWGVGTGERGGAWEPRAGWFPPGFGARALALVRAGLLRRADAEPAVPGSVCPLSSLPSSALLVYSGPPFPAPSLAAGLRAIEDDTLLVVTDDRSSPGAAAGPPPAATTGEIQGEPSGRLDRPRSLAGGGSLAGLGRHPLLGSPYLSGVRVLDTLELRRAFFSVYDGAVYLRQGESYLVSRVDLTRRLAWVTPAPRLRYYTQLRDLRAVQVLPDAEMGVAEWEAGGSRGGGTESEAGGGRGMGGEGAEGEASPRPTPPPRDPPPSPAPAPPPRRAFSGAALVSQVYLGFYRVWKKTNQRFDSVDLYLPSTEMRTRALWAPLPPGFREACRARRLDLRASLHAASHAVAAVTPLLLRVDPGDVDGECDSPFDSRARPQRILVFDARPGVGVADAALPRARELLRLALDLVDACPCSGDLGCPSCVQSPRCSEYNEVISKRGASLALSWALHGAPGA